MLIDLFKLFSEFFLHFLHVLLNFNNLLFAFFQVSLCLAGHTTFGQRRADAPAPAGKKANNRLQTFACLFHPTVTEFQLIILQFLHFLFEFILKAVQFFLVLYFDGLNFLIFLFLNSLFAHFPKFLVGNIRTCNNTQLIVNPQSHGLSSVDPLLKILSKVIDHTAAFNAQHFKGFKGSSRLR